MAYQINNQRTSPQGAFVVWSFKFRQNSYAFPSDQAALRLGWIYKLTKSLISISTNKTKSAPAGSFEIRLAPTANWVARLTPGSWCCILMTKDVELDLGNILSAKAEKTSLKMFGRITDVRVAVEVDAATGARRTEYVVTGKDWGVAFESNLYIDEIARNEFLTADGEEASAVGTAAKIFFDKKTRGWLEKEGLSVPTSTVNVKALLSTWGQPVKNLQEAADNLSIGVTDGFTLTSGTFKFPPQVLSYLHFDTSPPSGTAPSFAVADNISWYTGRLSKSDGVFNPDNAAQGLGAALAAGLSTTAIQGEVYEEIEEAGGYPDPKSTLGSHPIWQIMLDNSNFVLNEMLTDLRFEGDTPRLAIYKRIRPFVMTEEFDGSDEEGVKDKISLYKNVRTFKIPLGNVINIQAGTNYDQLRNFIEVRSVSSGLVTGTLSNQMKIDAQVVDRHSITRSGFKPGIYNTSFMPFNASKTDGVQIDEFVAWKYLLAQWHFNTYAQLNGQVSFLGQNTFIGVGDNLRISSKILGPSGNFNEEQLAMQDGKGGQNSADKTFLTCHVESLAHSFTVKPNGARSFVTTVRFSRGIITDKDGNQTNEAADIAIDEVAPTEWNDTTNVDVWSTSTDGDPTG